MGAVTGETFPGRHTAGDVSPGTGLSLGDLQRETATIITAGKLKVTNHVSYISGIDIVCLMLFYMNARNPDQSLMPWCRVRRGRRIVKEFCDIPRCKPDTGNKKIKKIIDILQVLFSFH